MATEQNAGDGVRDNREAGRYELTIDGRTSVLEYQRRPGRIVLAHTEVPPELRGHGVANTLAKFALDAARAAGERVVPRCPFVRAWLKRHPEYAAGVDES